MRIWAIAFLLGNLIVQNLENLPSFFWGIAAVVILLFTFLVRRFYKQPNLYRFITGVIVGLLWTFLHANLSEGHRLLTEFEGKDIVLRGYVGSLPHYTKKPGSKRDGSNNALFNVKRLQFDFVITKVQSPENLSLQQFPKKVRLSWYHPNTKVKGGDYLNLTVRLKRPYSLMNPGGFDYEQYLFYNQIQARGYIKKLQVVESDNKLISWRHSLLTLRQILLEQLNKIDRDEIRHLTQALLLGYRGNISIQQWETFQRTGTIHLMAISGLHIGLIAGLSFLLASYSWRAFPKLCLYLPAVKFAAICSLFAACIYALLAGFTIPTQRALIMLIVAMIHILLNRVPLTSSRVIAFALIIVLFIDPFAVLSQGFWLSFFAVGIIIYLVYQQHEIKNINKDHQLALDADNLLLNYCKTKLLGIIKALKKFTYIQITLTLLMLPLVVYFYQSSSLVSVVANFISIPLMSFIIIPAMFLASILLFFNDSIANTLFGYIDNIFQYLWFLLKSLSDWQYATVELSFPSVWVLVLCYALLFSGLIIRHKSVKWIVMVLLISLFFIPKSQPDKGEAFITVLDVGQGLSVVVQTLNHTVVFDTGPKFSERFDTGRAVIVPFLKQNNRKKIDRLIISHGDNDHIGGLGSLASLMPIKHIMTGIAGFQFQDFKIQSCRLGQSWNYDRVHFEMLSPAFTEKTETGHDENNQSCVLKITTRYGSILLTGDIEREAESALFHTQRERLKAEVLIVPHHGSNTSSLKKFIQAVAPQYAIFPVGYKNRYKLPSQKVVARYKANSKSHILQTSDTGAITFYFSKASDLSPVLFRKNNLRYWHTRP